MPELRELSEHVQVFESVLNMCMYGMTTQSDGVENLVAKPTRILTNSAAISEKLSLRCDGSHEHGMLKGGSKCAEAAKWPIKFVDAILTGYALERIAKSDHGEDLKCEWGGVLVCKVHQ